MADTFHYLLSSGRRPLSAYRYVTAPQSPLPYGSAPFGGWRHHLPPAKAVGLWVLGSGVKVSLWQQRRENHTTGLRPEENRQTALAGA